MIRRTYVAVAAATVLAVASVSTSTIAVARGGGGHGGGFHGGFAGRPLVPLLVPPSPTPHFNNPGPQITLSRPGNSVNPVNQQGLAAHLRAEALGGVSGGISEPSGGYREPKVSEVPQKENPSDAAMLKMDRELDNKLENGICRGC